MKNETKVKPDFYQNMNDKQVLKKAQSFGIKHILEQKEAVIPVRIENEFYIFLSFKKKGDEGYMYIRIERPEKNIFEAMAMVTDFKKKMNCWDVELHEPVKNVN